MNMDKINEQLVKINSTLASVDDKLSAVDDRGKTNTRDIASLIDNLTLLQAHVGDNKEDDELINTSTEQYERQNVWNAGNRQPPGPNAASMDSRRFDTPDGRKTEKYIWLGRDGPSGFLQKFE